MNEQDPQPPKSLGREVRDEAVREAGVWLKWAAVGALVGALLLGGLGLALFGFLGMLGGAGVGAVLGGVAFWAFYLNATTL